MYFVHCQQKLGFTTRTFNVASCKSPLLWFTVCSPRRELKQIREHIIAGVPLKKKKKKKREKNTRTGKWFLCTAQHNSTFASQKAIACRVLPVHHPHAYLPLHLPTHPPQHRSHTLPPTRFAWSPLTEDTRSAVPGVLVEVCLLFPLL